MTNQPKILGQRREVTGMRANDRPSRCVSEMKLGTRRHFTGIIRDITFTKEAERLLKSMAFKQGILDSAKLSIISTDWHGVMPTLTRRRNKYVVQDERELVGRATPEIFHDRDEITQRSIQLSEELGQSIRADLKCLLPKHARLSPNSHGLISVKTASIFPSSSAITALHDQHDNIIGFMAV